MRDGERGWGHWGEIGWDAAWLVSAQRRQRASNALPVINPSIQNSQHQNPNSSPPQEFAICHHQRRPAQATPTDQEDGRAGRDTRAKLIPSDPGTKRTPQPSPSLGRVQSGCALHPFECSALGKALIVMAKCDSLPLGIRKDAACSLPAACILYATSSPTPTYLLLVRLLGKFRFVKSYAQNMSHVRGLDDG
jgi:hypothetical protein